MKVWILGIFIAAVFAKNEEYDGWTSYYVVPYDQDELEVLNLILQKYDLDVYGYPVIRRECLVLVEPDKKKSFTDNLDELGIRYRIHAGDLKAWKSFYVKPSNTIQFMTLGRLISDLELDFIHQPAVSREGVVLVKPSHQSEFLNFMRKEKIQYWIHAENVKERLDIDDLLIESQRQATRSINREWIPYENYQPLEVIYEYLDTIAEKYKDIATLVTPDNSFEGRPLKYLKISKDNFQSDKPVIFIDAAIHAREWITPPVATYAIHKLVENVTETDLLEKFDWIVFPVVNPDGYKHSFDVARMWRKTRSTDQHKLTCTGVDGNRNYDFFWNTVGTSNDPCSDTYAGSRPFSEVEVRAVDKILKEHLDRLALYVTLHSFGSMILYPWGHDGSLSEHNSALHSVAIEMAEVIDSLSLPQLPRYTVGNSALVLNYETSGAAEDYAHSIGARLTFTLELPGIGLGTQGFHLDPIYIRQIAEETWAGLVAGARMAGGFFSGNATIMAKRV